MELKSETKEDLLLQSLTYFKKYGSKNVTMDDLASELAISKKTIYKYFSSKEELINECVDYLWIHFEQQTEEISKLKIDPLAKIILLYELGLQELRKTDSQFLYSLKRYYHQSMKKYEGFRKKLIFETLLGFLTEAKAKGFIRSEVNLTLFCELNLLDFDEKLYKFKLFERFENDEILDQLIKNRLRGIVKSDYQHLIDEI
jgi:AcrR family transcriptional regulator